MFLVAYLGEVPRPLGVPACALHHPVTVLDLITLPRVLAGHKIWQKRLGSPLTWATVVFCRDCPEC